jgi:transposase
MRSNDGRKLSAPELEKRRKVIIRMKEDGYGAAEIMTVTGCARQAIYATWNRYMQGQCDREKALKVKKRGVKFGQRRTLTARQEGELIKTIVNKSPEEFDLPYRLWTREALRQYIKKTYKIVIPIRTVGEYIKRWGLAARRPRYGDYGRDRKEAGAWFKEDYRKIQYTAKRGRAEIYWVDEKTIKILVEGFDGENQKTVPNAKKRSSMAKIVTLFSAAPNKGAIQWLLIQGTFDASRFIFFLEQLAMKTTRKKYIIVDNNKIHHNRKINTWIKEHRDQAALFYFPEDKFEQIKKSNKYKDSRDDSEAIKKLLEQVNEDYMNVGIPPVWWRATVKPH